ncbi:MAG: zf-HC2 domain-containing protein [Acidobacteriaceae bacterium]
MSWRSATGLGKHPFDPTPLDCEAAREHITLFLYGELSDQGCHALEQHLAGCPACREELQIAQTMSGAMTVLPVAEPSAGLLAQTRLRLDEALDRMPRPSWMQRARQSIRTDFRLLRTAPVAAATLLCGGMALGGFAGYHSVHRTPPPLVDRFDGPIAVAGVSSVALQPDSGLVQVEYLRLMPEVAVGSAEDPAIRELLVAGARSPMGPAVASSALGLLASACGNGRDCGNDDTVRNAFLVALRYDPSSQVRQQALHGLASYVADDMHVRDAMLEAVLDDNDPAVRSEAIAMLAPVSADSSVRQVLGTVASQDGNPRIRTVSQQVLNQIPQIQ